MTEEKKSGSRGGGRENYHGNMIIMIIMINCRFINCNTSYNNIKVRLSFTTIFLISYVTMLNFALKLEFSALPGKVYFIFFICSHVMAVVVVATNIVTS